jgi:hypothetical protein
MNCFCRKLLYFFAMNKNLPPSKLIPTKSLDKAKGLLLVTSLLLLSITSCDLFFGFNSSPIPTVTRATDSQGYTYEVGYIQVTKIRQDPYVRKRSPGGSVIWEIRHDETTADARAIAVALSSDDIPYVLFSVDGGSISTTRYQTHRVVGTPFNGKPFPSYGPGGGGKVSIVTRLNPSSGLIEAGTFIIARLDGGNTNTFNPKGLAVANNRVYVDGNSSAWPPGPGARSNSWVQHPDKVSGSFNNTTRAGGNDLFRVVLPMDLSELLEVTWLDNRR